MQDLTFKELVINIQAMKSQYKRILSLFSCGFDIKNKVRYISKTKIEIYGMFNEKWKADRIWDYFNDDLAYEELVKIANRQNVK